MNVIGRLEWFMLTLIIIFQEQHQQSDIRSRLLYTAHMLSSTFLQEMKMKLEVGLIAHLNKLHKMPPQ